MPTIGTWQDWRMRNAARPLGTHPIAIGSAHSSGKKLFRYQVWARSSPCFQLNEDEDLGETARGLTAWLPPESAFDDYLGILLCVRGVPGSC